MQKECIAMLLAGGEGSRLGVLTKERAKPAVPFGGKYRIIDFTLSNCVNSGIDTVGVLTQYQPLELNDYIGNGEPWDLDRMNGGVHILPPYQKRQGADWYKGTANAISQNITFIERYHPEYLLVLSGDHIYKMDYSAMLQFHKDKNADCTIAVIEVDLEEASRFGIMNTNEDSSIYEFEEKPANPKSNKASMGVYIFNWNKLKPYLQMDENNSDSSNDFGKNIIPTMLNAGEKMFAFPFRGYWKDVGTIESLWEANMDLIHKEDNIISTNREWIIYARSPIKTPHYINRNASIHNSIISEGCKIDGTIESSIIFNGVQVGQGSIIRNSILMPGTQVMNNSTIDSAIIAENVTIGQNVTIGTAINTKQKDFITVVGNNINIGDGITIKENSVLDSDQIIAAN